MEDICYERRRAEACVDESAHHALANAGGREIVCLGKEEGEQKGNASRVFPSRMQRGGSSARGNPVCQLDRAGTLIVGRPSTVASKGGRPRRKAAQENKAAKDTEDPLVKLERTVGLLDRGLVSVREYELLKQHRESVLFIGTQFSILYTSMYSPA